MSEYEAQDNTVIWLINIGNDLHLAKSDFDVLFNTYTYYAYPIEIPGEMGSDVDSPLTDVEFKVGCLPRPMVSDSDNPPVSENPVMAPLLQYIYSGVLTNKLVQIFRTYWDEQHHEPIGYDLAFVGHVNGDPGFDKDGWATFRCIAHAINWADNFGVTITRELFPSMPKQGVVSLVFKEKVKFV